MNNLQNGCLRTVIFNYKHYKYTIDIMTSWLYYVVKEVVVLKSFTLRMEDDLHKTVKLKAVETGIPMQEYIINLIKKDLEDEKNKVKK